MWLLSPLLGSAPRPLSGPIIALAVAPVPEPPIVILAFVYPWPKVKQLSVLESSSIFVTWPAVFIVAVAAALTPSPTIVTACVPEVYPLPADVTCSYYLPRNCRVLY